MTDDVVRLQRHREIGVEILDDLMRATADTWEKVVERQLAWQEKLIPLVEPLGPQAARFKPLTPMRPEEQQNAMRVRPLSHGHRRALVEQDVILYRLNELFAGFPPIQPKGKGGNRRTYNDQAIVGKARAILKSSDTESKTAAAREAIRLHPELCEGRGTPSNIARRIAGKM